VSSAEQFFSEEYSAELVDREKEKQVLKGDAGMPVRYLTSISSVTKYPSYPKPSIVLLRISRRQVALMFNLLCASDF
jgi:hypothetical protein